jgi:hypothetical protein
VQNLERPMGRMIWLNHLESGDEACISYELRDGRMVRVPPE